MLKQGIPILKHFSLHIPSGGTHRRTLGGCIKKGEKRAETAGWA